MLVDAFSAASHCNHCWWPKPIIPFSKRPHERYQIKGHLGHSRTVSITHDFTSDHYVATIPPFYHEDDHKFYPSLLHKIHVVPMLTPEETSHLLELSKIYAAEHRSWDQQNSTRHTSYSTVDFAVEDSDKISQYLSDDGIKFKDRIFSALSEAYDLDIDDLSFLDLFCASYEAASESDAYVTSSNEIRKTMDRLELHRDGSLLSFTILLSPLADFEGGGTIFDALRDVDIESDSLILQTQGTIQPPQAGYATLHSGKLLHGGHVVTKGQRVVLVGFVDVHDRNLREGVLRSAVKEWGRNDVRSFWNQRRLNMLIKRVEWKGNQNRPEWKLRYWRYLPREATEHIRVKVGPSCIGPDVPIPSAILKGMELRADPEKLRERKLSTEDKFLREILLSREERFERDNKGDWEKNGILIL